jgi:hypothetical protein
MSLENAASAFLMLSNHSQQRVFLACSVTRRRLTADTSASPATPPGGYGIDRMLKLPWRPIRGRLISNQVGHDA